MKRLRRYFMLLRIFLHKGGYKRAEYLRKKQYFSSQGKNCYLQPWNYGTEPQMISFGDNVYVASGVVFINHDVSVFMLRAMEPETEFLVRAGNITIGNNVFIGSNTTILYGIHIGNNVVIGAGSVVTRDIPDGVVAAGSPCKQIGLFDEWKERMKA